LPLAQTYDVPLRTLRALKLVDVDMYISLCRMLTRYMELLVSKFAFPYFNNKSY
jgi:hypothetical protein